MSDNRNKVYRLMLSYLPLDVLLRCRIISKAWCRLIDDPDFIRLHLRRQMGGDELFIRDKIGKFFWVSLNDLNFSETVTITIKAVSIKNPNHRSVPKAFELPVPSCDGLILISDFDVKKVWSLWNPFMRSLKELPRYDRLVSAKGMPCIGLGYDGVADDYKVVRFVENCDSGGSDVLETLVYSLKSDKWTRIPDFPDCRMCERGVRGVFVDGKLHWMAYRKQEGKKMESILSFDLSSEEYRWMPMPNVLSESREHPSDKHLDALGESLLLSCSYSMDRFDVWEMKDYGGENSWTKLISLNELVNIGQMLHLRPVAYVKSKGEVLMQYNSDKSEEFLCFDVEKKCTKKVNIAGIKSKNFSSQVFPANLIQLDGSDGTNGGNPFLGTWNKKRKRVDDNRLPLQLTTCKEWWSSPSW